MTRNDTMLMLLAAALVVAVWYIRREACTLTVPGKGRMLTASDHEREYWRGYYDGLAGEEGQP